MRNHSRRLLPLLAVIFMVVAMLSTTAFAVIDDPTEESGTTIRFCEHAGHDDPVTLKFHKVPTSVTSVDLNGREVPSDVVLNGNTVTVTAKAKSLTQLRIIF